jgi:uncharacterized repeat protein (TIGR03899 family)
VSIEQKKTGLTPTKKQQESIVIDSSENNQKTRSSSNLSTQNQLLILAKQFALDGAMAPESKQMPLEDRASRREHISLLRKQNNLESIIQKSLSYCPNTLPSTKADQDWFNQFTFLAQDISNNTMQDLWAKILAREVEQQGTFSLKSLAIFKSMSITDAKLLAKVCSLVVKDSSKRNTRIISGAYKTPGIFSFFSKNTQSRVNLNQCDISYSELLSLADNNIIFIQEAESNELQKGEQMKFNFNGKDLTLTAKKNRCGIRFYKFTSIGSELATLISDKPNKSLIPLLESSLKSHFSVSSS